MVELVLTAMASVEAIVIAAGVWIAIAVARLASHPPTGWLLLVISFASALVRVLLYLSAYTFAAGAADSYIFVGQVLGLPIVLFTFSGIYFLYRDFRRQLREQQAAMIAPQE